jgi:broad specificity phosphatase PhoE
VKFYLLRHGETEWNKLGKFQGLTDVSLNERGFSQARDSARAALGWEHAVIYASSLTRTVQVAEEIHKLSGAPVVTDPGLRELSLGDLEGITGAEMRADWPEVYNTWRNNPADVTMPSGETLAQLQERAWQSVLEIERVHHDVPGVVVVSHNFTIRTIICAVLDIPLHNFHRMSLGLGSLCTFDSDGNGRRLTTYNCNSHLSPENR